ncbi:hypothetical protein [Jeotgalibacillus campisalis]|uniref:Uncharacterized protein n=1 Tax=Jeotgalibacillus campisalis TaxID=220754 RepID=A0A0C2RCD4_9BACL|nr:hypothetical protein [Jeotgalibacillus campisalis]KIL47945.1 hypothetical protein KR50_21120 [Jeotgalibacillus campisalis]
MKLKILLLMAGAFFIYISINNNLVKETIYQYEMDKRYEITELNLMKKGISTKYNFENIEIDLYHELIDQPPVIESMNEVVRLANVFITINNRVETILERSAVKTFDINDKEENLNQYDPFISYWLIYDKEKKDRSFAVVLNTTKNNYYMLVPKEEQSFQMVTINENGNVKKDDYSWKTRSKLQGMLVPFSSYSGTTGYYTDSLNSYPSGFDIISTLTLPILSFLIGLVFVICCIALVVDDYKANGGMKYGK